jgi:hypothetical protein
MPQKPARAEANQTADFSTASTQTGHAETLTHTRAASGD